MAEKEESEADVQFVEEGVLVMEACEDPFEQVLKHQH